MEGVVAVAIVEVDSMVKLDIQKNFLAPVHVVQGKKFTVVYKHTTDHDGHIVSQASDPSPVMVRAITLNY